MRPRKPLYRLSPPLGSGIFTTDLTSLRPSVPVPQTQSGYGESEVLELEPKGVCHSPYVGVVLIGL